MESKSSTGSTSSSESFDWSSNASWRTHFDDSYSFENNSVDSLEARSVKRSLSQLSVLTAEPIDYDCTLGEVDFKPSEFSESQCSCGRSSTNSAAAVPVKQLVPGTPEAMNFGDAGFKNRGKINDKRDPSSFYHALDMNEGPVNFAPRGVHIQSQYHVPDMYDYPATMYSNLNVGKKVNFEMANESAVHEVKSEYFMDV
uniref:Ovule protein n=1 Tax=Panagrellus redivivus TaxID=6233 RepID=A0A7E4ZY72_PANRE